jgi:hypothetical protein
MLSETKRQVINLQNCCIWLVILFELLVWMREKYHKTACTSLPED